MSHANANKTTDNLTGDKYGLLSFPGGAAKPHEVRRWQRSLQSVQVVERLTDVAAGKLRPGKFGTMWSKSALRKPPEPPKDASWMTTSYVRYEYTVVMHAQNELMDAILTTRGAH